MRPIADRFDVAHFVASVDCLVSAGAELSVLAVARLHSKKIPGITDATHVESDCIKSSVG
jgi:hypothetical protein